MSDRSNARLLSLTGYWQSGKFVSIPKETRAAVQVPGKVVSVPIKALAALQVGDKIAYRYALHPDADMPQLSSSPWSDWVVNVEAGKLQQIYVGDGYATVDITRKIYLRTSESDEVGKLVATIRGHGIMTWPEDDHKASI
jgi:hypothetical protein